MMTGTECSQQTSRLCSFLKSHLYHTEPDREPDVSNVNPRK